MFEAMAEKVAAPTTVVTTGALSVKDERTIVERARTARDLYVLVDQYARYKAKWGDIKGYNETYLVADYAKKAFDGTGITAPTAETSVQEVMEKLIAVMDQAREALRNELATSQKAKPVTPTVSADIVATRVRYDQVLGLIGCDSGSTAYCLSLRRPYTPAN
jgi:hypothetical protein